MAWCNRCCHSFQKKNTTALLMFSCVRFLDIFGQQPSCCSSQVNCTLLLHCCFWRMSVNIRWEILQTSQSCLHQEFLSLVPISTSVWKYLTLNHNFAPFKYCLIWKCLIAMENFLLPNEIVLKILGYLGLDDLTQCARVSKRFNTICKDKSLSYRLPWIKHCCKMKLF